MSVSAEIINSCRDITQPGYYKLGSNISGLQSGKEYCIGIFASNVVLDGNGFSLIGPKEKNYCCWGKGIKIDSANNITVKNLRVSGYEHGIELRNSNKNTISNNMISNNYWGTKLAYSNNNTISNNILSDNELGGIDLWYSNYNTISNNNFKNCGLFVHGSYQNTVLNNTVNGKPLVYLENASNLTITHAGQVILV
ncbi:MAG: NosD domain-containing protein, partial [Archaeoglobaceae archaeon]|nr:NosD domain-containing protein [Archaeoglobaceae archaeon]